jgi:hypothetical protein
VTGEREAAPLIAEMPAPAALPRKSGEMVFHDEWERRAFAMAVSLAEQPSRGYYESWLVALEALLQEKELLPG